MPPIPRSLAAALIALCVASAAPRAAPDEPSQPEPAAISGVAQVIDVDGKGFSLKAAKGPYAVTWNASTRFCAHTQVTLADVAAKEKVHVLGEPLAAQPGNAGGNYPPQIVKVQAIVAGKDFEPPAVPAELVEQRIRWISESLTIDEKELRLGEHVLCSGLSREVLRVEEIPAKAPEKKSAVFVGGHLDLSDKKQKKLAATEVILLAPKYPSYDLTHDLKNRKPKPKEEKFGY